MTIGHLYPLGNRACNDGMDIDEIRRQNARYLAGKAGGISAFAELVGKSQSQMSQLIGKNPRKSIGRQIAREIEEACGKPHGWLDQTHRIEEPGKVYDGPPGVYAPLGNVEPAPATPDELSRQIPVIAWAHAGFDATADDFLQPGDALEWVAFDGHCSRYTYALYVRGESMWPEYMDGDLVIIDPEVPPRQGDDVIVRNAQTDEVTLKRFVDEGSARYLKALNRDYPEPIRIVTENDRFCGVVVDQRRRRRRG